MAKKSVIGLFLGLLGFPLLSVLVIPPGTAAAAGESFSWSDYSHIKVSGGNLKSTTFTKSNVSFTGLEEFGASLIDTSHGNCTFVGTISLHSNTSGNLFANTTTTLGDGSGGNKPCSSSIVSGWQNKSITISGTRPDQNANPETQEQKQVTIQLYSPLAADKSPAKVTATIQGAGGFNQVIDMDRVIQESRFGDTAIYSGVTHLEAGNYTITFSALVSGPQSFEKVKYASKPLNYGTPASSRIIKVVINYDAAGLPADPLGPMDVSLQKTGGEKVIIQTPPQDRVDAGGGGDIVHVAGILRTQFENVDPGTYTICVVSLNKCQTVTKGNDDSTPTVTFNLSPGESSTFVAAAQAASGSSTGKHKTCESIGALGWLVCPIIKMLDSFFNWVDSRIQALLDIDRDKYRDDDLYAVWSNVRNIAYAILVPVMLVMVLSTALGYEFVSAYTVKRALPRMVAAIMFIALSWQITGILIQVSNDAGRGVLGIMTAPLCTSAGVNECGKNGMTLSDLFDPSAGGAAVQGGAILAIGIATPAAIAGGIAVLGTIMSFLGTAALILLAAFIVLICRQLFVLAFIILSPLAIISWIFPGNDKLWKFWWSTFSKLLIMFPLITGLIGVGRIFAFIIGHSGSAGGEGGILNPIMKLIAYVIPYALIPLTFKFAGGAIGNLAGMVNDRQKGMFDRLKQGRARGYERSGRAITAKRADLQSRWQDTASGKGGAGAFRRGAARLGARGIGGYNIQAKASATQAGVAKELNDQIATGRDEEIRGLTVNKQAATIANGLKRIGADGQTEYKTLGGAWVTEAQVDAGKRRWGSDRYAQQAALSYEMRKAATDEEVQGIGDRYRTLATGAGGWGMSETQAAGALKGAGFENQNTHLEFKHMKTDGSINYETFAREAYEKKGSYALSQGSAHTFQRLKEAHAHAVATGDVETQRNVESVAETFMSRFGGGGGVGGEEAELAERTAAAVGGGGGRPSYQTNAPGSGHVAEAARDLAVSVGVYRPLDPSTETHSAGPPSSNPRQN